MTMTPSPQTIQTLRRRILSLSPTQQQLFRQQLEAKGIDWQQIIGPDGANHDGVKAEHSPDAVRPEQLPLSSAQQHLWLTHQLQADSSAYHIALALRFAGELDIRALRQSLQAIVDRHESLRTVFVEHDGQPFQQILPGLPLEIPILEVPIVDLGQTSPPGAVTEVIHHFVNHQRQLLAAAPFDLAAGPLLRARLLQLDEQTFELILVIHHIVADGWSRGILLKELSENYCSLVKTGIRAALAPLSYQYADYVVQQRQQAQGRRYHTDVRYWAQQLKGLTPLDLPRDRNSSTDFSSRTLAHTFSIQQTQSIKQFAQGSGVSLFMLLLAVFKLLLHRYSGQRDIAVGVPVAGRNSPLVEPLIGFFINTLVLRTRMVGVPNWGDWLQQVKVTLADAMEHQAVPFSAVVDALDIERAPGQNPLFNVMFQVQSGYQQQNAGHLLLDFPGLSVSQSWIELNQTKFDMSWHVIERDDQLMVAVEYRTALFESSRIQRLLKHFKTLLDAVLTPPIAVVSQRPISQFAILSLQDRQHILANWRQTAPATSFANSFPQRFEHQVEATPNAVAIQSGPQTVTYAQLNQRANQLAHWLQRQGVTPKARVGICLASGVNLMTALLGTLKAGAAYIPLDPSLPKARLQYMVQDATPSVLITHSETLQASRFDRNALGDTRVLVLDEQAHVLDRLSDKNPSTKFSASHLAYVIYTSGSTGQPKGTLLTHAGLINYLDWCLTAYPLDQGKGVPVHGSIGFDATITSLFAPLLAGQPLLFNLGKTEVESIQAALQLGVSLIKLTPAHLSALEPLLAAQTIDQSLLPKALVIGGEALHQHHLSLWQEQFPDVALFNEYGPTEAVVGCCVHRVTSEDRGAIPIGYPIHGAQLYVLDEYLQPVPAGIPGELYIGGAGVAQGYLNRPELTQERFISNPFAQQDATAASASVLYKTGDLVCYQTNGSLTYLGRKDRQLKLRGFRIEPGEIESALCQHPEVDQAVVLLREEGQSITLVSYVLAPEVNAFEALITELQQYLGKTLPSYMVPHRFVLLDHLPLTVNGKVDRQALPAPTSLAPDKERNLPQTEKEEALSEIWQQILGQDQIGVNENFFSLGGDSISAMQIVAKARQQGLYLTPAQLFEHQTVAEQAAIATEMQAQSEMGPVSGDAPLGPIQQDFLAQARPQPHHYNQSVMLAVDSEINAEAIEVALQYLVQHHDALRLRFERTANAWKQRYEAVEAVRVPFETVDLTLSGQSLDEAVTSRQASLSLSEGPLFRGALLQLVSGHKRLLLVAHHLLVDGLSWRIILDDLMTLYRQALATQPLSLPPRTTAFGQWTRHLQEQSFEAERKTWSTVCQPVPPLPVDNADGTNKEADRVTVTVTLDAHHLEQLQSLDTRLDTVLLTGLAQTLTQWTRHNTTVIDIEGHGRHTWDNSLDLSRTVGWFTARFPVRLLLLPGSLQEQLNAVNAQLRRVPNHGVGYGVLRAASLHSGKLSSNGSAQRLSSPAEVSFNYLGQLDPDTHQGPIQGLTMESLAAMRGADHACRYQIEIVSFMRNSAQGSPQLHTLWRYSQHRYQRQTIIALAQGYLNHLLSWAAQQSTAQRAQAQQPSPQQANVQQANLQQANLQQANGPSRFSASQVDTQQLNQLMRKLKTKGRA
ncbi:MAG: amino acid adenylation domain-containing protein [Cyanobacteria bacterium P01_A01_bin.105]